MEFSRQDRNVILPVGEINGGIKDGITAAEINILTIVKESSQATNTELSAITGKSTRTISRFLASLKRKGLIVKTRISETTMRNKEYIVNNLSQDGQQSAELHSELRGELLRSAVESLP